MSYSSFLPMEYTQSLHHSETLFTGEMNPLLELEMMESLRLAGGFKEELWSNNYVQDVNVAGCPIGLGHETSGMYIENEMDTRKENRDVVSRVAFRTKSDIDVLDDGYRWRKYGKKSVKSNTNLRNYYKCSSEGCRVKKRIERDKDDPSYVITAYDGLHDHECPGSIYYNKMPLMDPDGFTLESSTHSPYSSTSF